MLFEQKTDMPDYCVYFALRDAGIKDISVYVDEESYKLENAIGVFN